MSDWEDRVRAAIAEAVKRKADPRTYDTSMSAPAGANGWAVVLHTEDAVALLRKLDQRSDND